MKTDKYTKTMLTIIAACLLWISVSLTSSQDLVRPASAQQVPRPAPVYLVGINPNLTLPVNLASPTTVPVDIVSATYFANGSAFPVDISYIYGNKSNPLPVRTIP